MEIDNTKKCIGCLRTINAEHRYCYYCGKKQQQAEDEILTDSISLGSSCIATNSGFFGSSVEYNHVQRCIITSTYGGNSPTTKKTPIPDFVKSKGDLARFITENAPDIALHITMCNSGDNDEFKRIMEDISKAEQKNSQVSS